MATIIQQLKGTAAEVAAKTYAVGVLVWNETSKRWHGHDGVTAGGIPMARYDERNDGSLGDSQRVETAASNAVTFADIGRAIVGNRATAIAFNLDPAASLTGKFVALFKNIGAGAMTIVPNGTELIDGANAAITVPTGSSVIVKGDGTSFRTFLANGDVTGSAINGAAALTGANLADNDKLGVYDTSAASLASMTITEFIAGLFKTTRKIANAYFLSSFRLWDATDNTKGLGWVLSSITTATTRLITMADRDVNLNNVPTPFVAYTPTFTGFGTPTNVLVRSRRNGAKLDVEFQFTIGTATAVNGAMTLGFNGANGGITVDAAATSGTRLVAGVVTINSGLAASYYVIALGGDGFVNFGAQTSGGGGLNPITGSSGFGSGVVISGSFSVPIQGWNV